jgi:hypothetical protein
MTTNCTCPFCPLNAINLQVCDVIVTFSSPTLDKYKISVYDASYKEIFDKEEVRDCVSRIVYYFIDGSVRKWKIGQSVDEDRNHEQFHITKIDKLAYKFCYHTKKKKECEEDPLPMD